MSVIIPNWHTLTWEPDCTHGCLLDLEKVPWSQIQKRHLEVLGIGVAFPRIYAPNFSGVKFKSSLEVACVKHRTPFQYQIDGSVAVQHEK